MFPLIGSIISAGSSLLGGLFGQKNQKDIAAQNIAMQQDFEKNGLTYKAEDATNAEKQTGINRLALLGTPTNSFSNIVGSNDLGAGIGSAGQDIGRAVGALAPAELRTKELENKLLEAKIAATNADTVHQQAVTSSLVKAAQPGSQKPLLTTYIDDQGRPVRTMSKDASSSFQNWASLPDQVYPFWEGIKRNFDPMPDYHLPNRGDFFRGMSSVWDRMRQSGPIGDPSGDLQYFGN